VSELQKWLIRFAGITGLTFLTLFVFFHSVGRINVAWALPWTKPFRAYWPDLPVFASWKTTTSDGREETIYQVPSRTLTPEEIAHLRYTPPPLTNAAPAISPLPPAGR
jgi:hypothetical protein